MYPFTKYLKFLIKDVKIVWARSMKGISSPPPGQWTETAAIPLTLGPQCQYFLCDLQPLIVWAPSGGGL